MAVRWAAIPSYRAFLLLLVEWSGLVRCGQSFGGIVAFSSVSSHTPMEKVLQNGVSRWFHDLSKAMAVLHDGTRAPRFPTKDRSITTLDPIAAMDGLLMRTGDQTCNSHQTR